MIKEQLIREAQAKQNVHSQQAAKMDKPVSCALLSLRFKLPLFSLPTN